MKHCKDNATIVLKVFVLVADSLINVNNTMSITDFSQNVMENFGEIIVIERNEDLDFS